MKIKLFFAILFLSTVLVAQDNNIGNKVCSYDNIEKSYLSGFFSDNLGLRISSAYFLGEIKSSMAVIPLMEMLRNSESEEERLIAALSLTKIGDERGIYLLKYQSEFSDCERVRCMCEKFYNAYLVNKYPDIANIAFEGDEEFIMLTSTIDPDFQLQE